MFKGVEDEILDENTMQRYHYQSFLWTGNGVFFNSKTINSKMNTSKILKNNNKQRKKRFFFKWLNNHNFKKLKNTNNVWNFYAQPK